MSAVSTFVRQTAALLVKKFHEVKRDKKFFFSGLVFPLMCTAIILVVNFTSSVSNLPSFSLVPTEFIDNVQENVVPFVDNTKQNDSDVLRDLAPTYGSFPVWERYDSQDDLNSHLAAVANQSLNANITMGSIVYDQGNYTSHVFPITVMFNASTAITLPTYLLWVSSSILRYVSGDDTALFKAVAQNLPSLNDDLTFLAYGPFLLEYGFVFLIPFFACKIVEEKEKKLKHQLLLNSMMRGAYWTSHFIGDWILYMIPFTICFILFEAFSVPTIAYNNFFASILLFGSFGFVGVLVGYLLSFIFDHQETANKWLYSIMSILTVIPYVIEVAIFGETSPEKLGNWIYVMCAFPPFGLYTGVSKMTRYAFFAPMSFSDTFDFNRGIIQIVLIFLIESILILLFIVALDFQLHKGLKLCKKSITWWDIEKTVQDLQDQDVRDMKASVMSKEESHRYNVKIDSVWKVFGEPSGKGKMKAALKGVTLGIEAGQCFGLLGPNGAGKTTLINIISGVLQADRGDVYIAGNSVAKNPDAAYRRMGVCPQFDVLFDLLTGREHLVLFGRIKGIPKATLDQQIARSLKQMDLEQYANRLSSTYSGGNKRKLSVSLALLGDPSIVFLDEPSTGMDPATRRKMWAVLQEMKKGRAIILTTHSMEEADALCETICVMVKGQLRCIGSGQHLKNTYGSGYRLIIKAAVEKLDDIHQFVMENYPDAIPQMKLAGSLNYELNAETCHLSTIFQLLQSRSEEFEIADYAVINPTLEQVFLRFAREQEEPDQVDE